MKTSVYENFKVDTKDHVLTVVHDQGLHRCLRWQAPSTWNYGLDVVTYPGGLLVRGDMGSWCFERHGQTDQLWFHQVKVDAEGRPHIDFTYWAEKCQAFDRQSKIEKFCRPEFDRQVQNYMDEENWSAAAREQFAEDVPGDLDDRQAHEFLADWSFEDCGFYDTREWDFNDWSDEFIWICYALAAVVRQYEALEKAAVPAA